MEPRDHVLEHKEDVRPRGGGLRRNRAFTSLAGLLVVPVALQRSTKTRSTRPGRLGCRPRRLRTTEFALSSDIALPPHSDRLLARQPNWRLPCRHLRRCLTCWQRFPIRAGLRVSSTSCRTCCCSPSSRSSPAATPIGALSPSSTSI